MKYPYRCTVNFALTTDAAIKKKERKKDMKCNITIRLQHGEYHEDACALGKRC